MDDPHSAKIIQQNDATKTLQLVLAMVKVLTDPHVAGIYSAETLTLAMKDIQQVIEESRRFGSGPCGPNCRPRNRAVAHFVNENPIEAPDEDPPVTRIRP